MMRLVTNDLIGEPTIGSANRNSLLGALGKYVTRHNDNASKAKAALAVCKALEIEYQTMPSAPNNRRYYESEKLQIAGLKFLKDELHHREGNLASIRALYELSPSKNVRVAAQDLLNLQNDNIGLYKLTEQKSDKVSNVKRSAAKVSANTRGNKKPPAPLTANAHLTDCLM